MSVLVDTSVWIDHLRRGNKQLVSLLEDNQVRIHSCIIGELSCGKFKNRRDRLEDLRQLANIYEASPEESLAFLELNQLYGKGLSWVDVQLLTSAKLSQCELWTMDKTLKYHAHKLDI